MRAVTFYHKVTGELGQQLVTSDDALIEANTPPDYLYVEGLHDKRLKYVDVQTGEVLDKPRP